MRSKGAYFAIALLFVAGLSVLLYPAVSNLLASRNHSRAIADYALSVESLTQREVERQWALAEAYNQRLADYVVPEESFGEDSGANAPEDYLSLLHVGGVMGYVDIPGIGVHLPIYHTSSAEVLRRGAGHLSTSSLPVGGKGSHAVLTAHRGLPSARLFTDLNLLELGEEFSVVVLNRELRYQVDQILVVEPHETEALLPQAGRDYLTLITCTPYAVNSHRLLVRGERVETTAEEALPGEPAAPRRRLIVPVGVLLVLLLAAVELLVVLRRMWRRKRARTAG